VQDLGDGGKAGLSAVGEEDDEGDLSVVEQIEDGGNETRHHGVREGQEGECVCSRGPAREEGKRMAGIFPGRRAAWKDKVREQLWR
jgi:hypothetical protein